MWHCLGGFKGCGGVLKYVFRHCLGWWLSSGLNPYFTMHYYLGLTRPPQTKEYHLSISLRRLTWFFKHIIWKTVWFLCHVNQCNMFLSIL